jgi:hypothetical protein
MRKVEGREKRKTNVASVAIGVGLPMRRAPKRKRMKPTTSTRMISLK